MSPRKAVVLDSVKLHWLTGFSEQAHANAQAEELLATADERRSIPYGEIRELRLESHGDERQLSFCDQSGHSGRWRIEGFAIYCLAFDLESSEL